MRTRKNTNLKLSKIDEVLASKTKPRADKVVTVRLNEKKFKELTDLAEKEKVSKSSVLKRALDFYLEQKNTGGNLTEISSRLKELEKRFYEISELMKNLNKIGELERKYYELVNRVNIISRQLESLQKRR